MIKLYKAVELYKVGTNKCYYAHPFENEIQCLDFEGIWIQTKTSTG